MGYTSFKYDFSLNYYEINCKGKRSNVKDKRAFSINLYKSRQTNGLERTYRGTKQQF